MREIGRRSDFRQITRPRQTAGDGDRLRLHLDDGDAVECGEVLYATGRRPLVADLGLANCGVALGPHGEILVDAYSRSNVPNIWAIGRRDGPPEPDSGRNPRGNVPVAHPVR